jgi:hypothetical protein
MDDTTEHSNMGVGLYVEISPKTGQIWRAKTGHLQKNRTMSGKKQAWS